MMTADFLCAPIMRLKHCWTLLHVSILAVLLLQLNADSNDSRCDFQITVHRGIVYTPLLGEDLRIECPFEFCGNSSPTISWYKLEDTAILIDTSNNSRIKTTQTFNAPVGASYLIFQNTLTSDSGEYQCRNPQAAGQIISVAVSDRGESTNITPKTDTNTTNLGLKTTEDLWLYVYTAAGIVVFVIVVVIISVASMHGCKGKTKKEAQTENQYMVIPMVEHPVHHPGLPASPRGSPTALPSRRSTRRKPPPSQPPELPRDNEYLHGEMTEGQVRERRAIEEEGGSLVYAALNHQPPTRVAPRPRRPKEEECSEYAAIRVTTRH